VLRLPAKRPHHRLAQSARYDKSTVPKPSIGCRPGRSQHNALDAFAVGLYAKKVNWVLDVDIRGFYDTIDHGWMQKFTEHRLADRRVLRLIQKWMKAGVMEQGRVKECETGIQQGASLSPLLGNLYLHYVLDLWAQAWRNKAHGDVMIVRYVDDVLIGFEHRQEAEQFQRELSTAP
jgi:RNA-directed DNA polymerase